VENRGKPGMGSIIDDPAAAGTTVERLKSLEINTVYPGHGELFPWELFPWEQFLSGTGK